MLKKFKTWYQNIFKQQERLKRRELLDVKNHQVEIRDTLYFLAKAQFTDIPEILGIERAVYGGKTPWDSTAFAAEINRINDRLYLVLRWNDRLLAFVGCSFDHSKKEAHVTNIAVVPDYQNRGLGYFLMTTVIKKTRELEYLRVTLEVRISNEHAQRIYRDLGFQNDGIKRGYYFGDHEDAQDMTLILN